jgi:hypothetical protein
MTFCSTINIGFRKGDPLRRLRSMTSKPSLKAGAIEPLRRQEQGKHFRKPMLKGVGILSWKFLFYHSWLIMEVLMRVN